MLTDNNLADWIDVDAIPFYKKLRKSYPAAASDLVRALLLATYGGLWIDSTVVVNSDSQNFLRQKLKLYDQFILSYAPNRTASWLIATKQKNYAMRIMFSALALWLKDRNNFLEYFQFHTFFEIFSMLDNDFFKKEYINASNGMALSKDWNSVRPVSYIENIFEILPFQKLSYRVDRKKVRPRTVQFLYENFLNPTGDEALKNIFLLPDGKQLKDQDYYTEEVQKVMINVDMGIYRSVDFTPNNKISVLKKGAVVTIEYLTGTIAGTPRLKIANGYISANKRFSEQVI